MFANFFFRAFPFARLVLQARFVLSFVRLENPNK